MSIFSDYSSKRTTVTGNGTKINTYTNGKDRSDSHYVECRTYYDSKNNYVKGKMFNGALDGANCHDNHIHTECNAKGITYRNSKGLGPKLP